jgi:hypothetical protein
MKARLKARLRLNSYAWAGGELGLEVGGGGGAREGPGLAVLDGGDDPDPLG